MTAEPRVRTAEKIDCWPTDFLSAPCPGALPLKVLAGIEDSLALMRTAVLLARHYRVSLMVVLPEAQLARNGSPAPALEIHLGTAPCTALVAGFLDSIEQRLRAPSSESADTYLVELAFVADSQAFLVRIAKDGAPTAADQGPPASVSVASRPARGPSR